EVALGDVDRALARQLAVAPVVDQREQQRALVREVVVERAHADARRVGDLLHRRRLVALDREAALGRHQQAPAGGDAARLGAAGHGLAAGSGDEAFHGPPSLLEPKAEWKLEPALELP